LVTAADKLRGRKDVGIVVIGDGVRREALAARVASLDLDNMVFVPPRPLEAMPGLIAAADAQLVCLSDRPLFRITLPSKLQATLASGSPVITSASGDAARLTDVSGAGMSAAPGDAEALAAAVANVADASPSRRAEWGRSGRAHYEEFYSQAHAVVSMNSALRRAKGETS
jgi:glycosyltransferase involved in cell wall biosynthesis